MTENALQDTVQKPIFAPTTPNAQQLGDDIDLNEIFADYFISEFNDPLNAYTSSMANYSGAAAAVALAQKQQLAENAHAAATAADTSITIDPQQQQPQQPLQQQQQQVVVNAPVVSTPMSGLPTGGIKTAFHVGVIPQQQTQQQLVTQPSPTSEPAAKRLKPVSDPMAGITTTTVNSTWQPQQPLQPLATTTIAAAATTTTTSVVPNPMSTLQSSMATLPVAAAPSTNAPIAKSAISGRLGFSMVGGQLTLPQKQQEQERLLQQQQQALGSKVTSASGIELPVGVGIKLGGIGGVAPSTATNQHNFGNKTGGAISEQAIQERRQRNREHAKRSRVRKKFMLESLQEQVRQLQKENVELRMLIQQKIPLHAQQIITDCCCKNSLFADPDDANANLNNDDHKPPESNNNGNANKNHQNASGDDKASTALVKSDFSLIASLTTAQQNFVLSDPRLPDNPIVYASPGFYELTGYTQDQVLGRNCRFLQGPGTDPRAVDIIRTAIANGSDSTSCILNYKADGTPFWNQFFVAALRDSDNCIVNYVGVQCEVEPEAGTSALEDKVNSVLPLQQKGDGDDK